MIAPYITFHGNCSEALLFYREVFQTEITMLQRYGEYIPAGLTSPLNNVSDWVLHAEMQICGTSVWFADETEVVKRGNMVKLTAIVPNGEVAQNYFDLLQESGNVTLPPTETFYSTFHAAVTDRYGICWNIVAEESPAGNLKRCG